MRERHRDRLRVTDARRARGQRVNCGLRLREQGVRLAERRGRGHRVWFNLGLDQRTSIHVPIWMILVGALRWRKFIQFCQRIEAILPVTRVCHNSMHFCPRGPVEILLK